MITFLPQQNVALLSPWFDHYYANGKQAYLQQIMTIFFSKISTLLLRWYNLEMRQLRLRHDIKVRKLSMSSTKYFSSQGLYLYTRTSRCWSTGRTRSPWTASSPRPRLSQPGLKSGSSSRGGQSWTLNTQSWTLGPCIKDLSIHPHADSLLSKKKPRIARNNKRSDFDNSGLKLFTNFIFSHTK